MAPEFRFNGVGVHIEDFVAKIDEVGNMTIKDYIAISSIMPEKTEFKEDGKKVYRPMPRDRDQAFSIMGDGYV